MEWCMDPHFEQSFGATSGPDVPLFKKVQEYWPDVDQEKFKVHDTGDIPEKKQELVDFTLGMLNRDSLR